MTDGAPQTLPQLLEGAAQRFGPLEALGFRSGRHFQFLDYRTLAERVASLRAGLRAAGLARGDRVALIADNCPEWVVIAFATFGLGAVLVPLYEAQSPKDWEYILRDSGAKLAFARTARIRQLLVGLRNDLPDLNEVVCLDGEPGGSLTPLIERGTGQEVPVVAVAPSDLATLIYTSGTTGRPKGVRLSHQNLCSNVRASCERYRFGPGDRSVAFLPWAHAFGQTAELYVLLWSGATVVINDDISRLADNLARCHPTVLVAVPRIFNRIYASTLAQIEAQPAALQRLFHSGIKASLRLRRGEARLLDRALHLAVDRLFFAKIRAKLGGRLRFVISGSAALSPEVAAFIDALGVNVFEGYGMTEASPVISSNFAGHHKPGSVGLPLGGVTVRIEPHPLARPGEGEIVVMGPNVMLGYYGLPEETAKVLRPDGSLRTGDLGRLDDDGYLYLTGRIKEQYKLENGKYVVPSPLEEHLQLSPLIEQVMLYGDGRPHNVALIVADLTALAARLGRSITREASADDRDVRALFEQELKEASGALKGYERPRSFAVLPFAFTQENGLLTPSLKAKRPAVVEKLASLIEGLYGTEPAPIDSQGHS